jgi:hypothetical protein
MPDPQLKFDKEELTITLTGLGGGWSFGQLGELSLFDSAQVQFPSMWNDRKMTVAARIIESQWRLSARVMIEQTLEAGVDFTDKNGNGQSLSLDSALKAHLLDRPTVQIDLRLGVKLEGTFDGSAFDGSGQMSIGLRGRF